MTRVGEHEVSVRRVQLTPRLEDGMEYSGQYTDVHIRAADGQEYYSRLPGWDAPESPGHHLAQWERRRRPGFYRQEG